MAVLSLLFPSSLCHTQGQSTVQKAVNIHQCLDAASAMVQVLLLSNAINRLLKGLTLPKGLFLNPASVASITCKARLDFNPEATASAPLPYKSGHAQDSLNMSITRTNKI